MSTVTTYDWGKYLIEMLTFLNNPFKVHDQFTFLDCIAKQFVNANGIYQKARCVVK